MRIHYLQHVSFEGLGYMEAWLQEWHYKLSATRFYEPGYKFPAVADVDALIIMGGPMGVYDEEQYPWLQEEKVFIKACVLSGKKVLGICLGAQLVAACLNAKVDRAVHKEIGWFPVQPATECQQFSWFYELFKNNPVVFHWHGDRFGIPGNSKNLLMSEANTNQAFCYGKNVIGLQFHLEVTELSMKQMLANGAADLEPARYVQSEQAISEGMVHMSHCNQIMAEVLQRWLG
ncbi:type 1 glutamine amidotransferase [Niabella soli]|uniref:Glutamine amidotransferase n=1 Tax=Niabella soli DSM 19437 TaxID=929713 RepID=H1NM29_9BACT|nr:type 1 glutamine amidotransferase [Niabella soli]AHF14531.1 glutamine amidotransferase [Niabella soli DSM 19437]